jgi:hypothetical protein
MVKMPSETTDRSKSPNCSGVLGTTHGGVRHSFVIQQYPESSPLELTIHSFFVQRPLLLLLESRGQRPPQKVPSLPFLHHL